MSAYSWKRARFALGCIMFICFPLFYKFLVGLAVGFKVAIAFEPGVLCGISFHTTILSIAKRLPTNTDLGWYLITSSFSLLCIHSMVKWIEYIARTLSFYLHRWGLNAKVDLHFIACTLLVGAILLVDPDFGRVRIVRPFLLLMLNAGLRSSPFSSSTCLDVAYSIIENQTSQR